MGSGDFLKVDQMDYALLVKLYSCKENHHTLVQMKLFQVPHLDGQVVFYQKMWGTVKDLVWKFA